MKSQRVRHVQDVFVYHGVFQIVAPVVGAGLHVHIGSPPDLPPHL